MKKMIKSLVLAGVMAAAAGTAFAQMGEGMMGHEGMPHRDPARMEQMHAKHLSDLKAQLKITATQEPAWTAFTDAMKPPVGMMGTRPDRAEMDKLTTPERIDKMRALHKERMAAMEAVMDKRDSAVKTFYAVLSAEQKKVFDAEHAKMGMHEGKGHPMHGADSKSAQSPKQ
jgi:Spy/CpxP family protein refolding chaperone